MDKNFKKSFIKGSVATSIGQVSTIGLQFVSLMFIARYTTKETFGLFVLILAICATMQLLAGLGLDITLIREISRVSSSDMPQALPIILLRTLALGIVSLLYIILANIILPLLNQDLISVKYILIIIFSLGSYRDLSLSYLQGRKAFKLLATTQVISSTFKLCLYLGTIYFFKDLSLNHLLYIEIFYALFSIIIQNFSVPGLLKNHKKISFVKIKELVKFGITIYVNNIIAVINNRANTFIIAAYLSPVSIALFDIAGRIPQAMSKMYQAFIQVFFPHVSELFSTNKKSEATELIFKASYAFTIFLSIIVTTVFVFRNDIIIVLFSSKYIDSAFALSILTLSFLIGTQTGIIGYSLVASGFPSLSVKTNVPSIGLGILTSILLIPQIGFMGAVLGALANNILALILAHYYLKRLVFN